MGWWLFTRSAIRALTEPSADAAACDRAMEALARQSAIGRVLHRCSVVIRSAWFNSRARAAAAAFAGTVMPRADVKSVRIGGWMAALTGVTALALDALKPMPVGPLWWLVPSLVIAAGLLAMLTAPWMARAAADRRARGAADRTL